MRIELHRPPWLIIVCICLLFVSAFEAAADSTRLADLRGIWLASFNHDASRIVIATRNEEVRLWDAKKGTQIAGDPALKKPAISFQMSPDARRFLVEFKDGRARAFDASTGSAVSPPLDLALRESENQRATVFSPDGGTIMSFGEKEASILEVKTGKRIATVPVAIKEEGGWEPIATAIFASGGARCFVMGPQITVTAYETKTWTPLGKPMSHPPAEMAYDFGFEASTDGKWLVTFDDTGENGPKGQLQAWDATTNKPLGDPLSAVNGMSGRFLPGQDRLLVQSGRGDATVRDLPSMAIAYTIKMHDELDGPKVDVFPNGKWLLAWGPDKRTDLIDAATGAIVDTYISSASLTSALLPADSSVFYLAFDNSAFSTEGYSDNYLLRFSVPKLTVTGSVRTVDGVLRQSISSDTRSVMILKGDTEHERIVVFDAVTLKPVEWSKP